MNIVHLKATHIYGYCFDEISKEEGGWSICPDIVDWLHRNATSGWKMDSDVKPGQFYGAMVEKFDLDDDSPILKLLKHPEPYIVFDKASDAVLFKLTWC